MDNGKDFVYNMSLTMNKVYCCARTSEAVELKDFLSERTCDLESFMNGWVSRFMF